MDSMEALRWVHRNGLSKTHIVVEREGLISRVYLALKNDDRIGKLTDGRSVIAFMVPEGVYDEMLLSLED